ncbi:hypothetical protein KIPB_005336, partial [Kipferlia bialata]|eukprot:g5336.t1
MVSTNKKKAKQAKRRAAYLASKKTSGKIGGKPTVPQAPPGPHINPMPGGNPGPFMLGRRMVMTNAADIPEN